MIKLIDVAQKAGVSLATASLALNDNPAINEKTREKIKYWAERLNYIPNLHAKRLAAGKNYNILIMLNSKYFFNSPNIYYLKVLGGIIRESKRTEYLISFDFFTDNNGTNQLMKKGNFSNYDGIVVFDIISKTALNSIKKKTNVPILLIDNHTKFRNVYGVDNDDFGGAYKATKYIIKQGHKKIGYLGIPDSHPLGKECWKGFKKALKEYNLEESIFYKKCGFDISSGRMAINKLLSQKRCLPTAFFCCNDYIAIGAIEQLKKEGFKIPKDVSFIGMDDMELSSEIDPSLTTIKIMIEEIGVSGIKKIIALINNKYKGKMKTIVDNKLIIRKSCRKLDS